MACAFCRSTPVSPCPVCEVKPVTQVLRRTPGRAPAQPAVAPKAATPAIATTTAVAALPRPAQAVPKADGCRYVGISHTWAQAAKVREAWEAGQVTLAGIEMVRIHPDLNVRTDDGAYAIDSILLTIADNASIRGFITEKDAKLRASIIESLAANWKRVHGFDPRFEAPPAPKAQASIELDTRPTSPERPALTGPKTETEVPALALGLVVGDWSTLNALVNSGTLTHAEGMAVKARWDAAAKSTDDVLSALLANRKPALA